MTTIVNNPPANQPAAGNSGGPIMLMIVLVVVLVLGYLGYMFGLPALRNMQQQSATPQINVPNKIDINVHSTP